MKKWIALFVVGGAVSSLGLGGSASTAPAVGGTGTAVEPCPLCCPPEICGYNGPSFDGTTEPVKMER
jgi:hypothetical protein